MMARQMPENFRVKGKKLYFVFVDLEKASERMPRQVISWAMRKLGVEEWLVSAVISMYTGAKTLVRTALSPLKSTVIVMKPYLENSGLPCHGNCCMQMTWQ